MSEINLPVSGQVTVVAVDDEETILELVVEVLADLGVQARATGSPQSALEILENIQQVDLLITDVRMPGMSGVDLAEQARRLHPDLPVLFITGYSVDFHEGSKSLEAGTALLTKPFTLDLLADTIRNMLR